MKYSKIFFLAVVLLSVGLFSEALWAVNCIDGFVGGWGYSAKTKKVMLDGITLRKLCHFPQDEYGANIQLKILKGQKIVHQVKLAWDNELLIEGENNKKGEAMKVEDWNIKNVNVPFSLEAVDRWKAIELGTKNVLGEGDLSK